MFYKLQDNKIVAYSSEKVEEDWLETDKQIEYSYALGYYVLAEEIDEQAEEQALAILNTPTLDDVKANKINELKLARDTEEISPIEYGGYRWDFDDKAQQRINGGIIALSNGGAITWTSADNREINNVNADDLKGVVGAAAIRSNVVHVKYRQLKALVEQAETIDDVNAVRW